jgi:hypothetical protein
MFLGHFGVALAAKKAAQKASLGTFVLAAQLADLLWPIFLLFGWEQVRIAPGNTRVIPLEFTSYPYSHSLVAQLLWGLAIGIVYFAFRRDARSALVLAVIVPSHWVLDYVAHRPDLPILPGGARYGLGMWNSLPLTLIVECALYGAGIAVYLKTTRSTALGIWLTVPWAAWADRHREGEGDSTSFQHVHNFQPVHNKDDKD